MFYLQVVAPKPEEQQPRPRDIVQGPFASASEARGYWTKLTMWFPETMQGANYRITDHEIRGDVSSDRGRAR